MSKYAFRCKKCGRLHTSDDAAEAPHPHACQVCGAGFSFNEYGHKTIDPTNWEVLCNATIERLQQLGLSQEGIVEHKRWPRNATSAPINVTVSATDAPVTQDKGG